MGLRGKDASGQVIQGAASVECRVGVCMRGIIKVRLYSIYHIYISKALQHQQAAPTDNKAMEDKYIGLALALGGTFLIGYVSHYPQAGSAGGRGRERLTAICL